MQFAMCVLSSLILKYFHTPEADIVSVLRHVRYRSIGQVHELGIGPDADTGIGIGASLVFIVQHFTLP